MRFRSIAIRVVLIASALASVATSAPEDFRVSDTRTLEVTGPATVRVYARANLPAFEQADELRLEFWIGAEPGLALNLVPDDPSQPVVEAVLDDGYWFHQVVIEAGDPCPLDTGNGCELGVSFDVPEGVSVTVEATGYATRYGDPSFFFPENREFSQDAAMEVGFNE